MPRIAPSATIRTIGSRLRGGDPIGWLRPPLPGRGLPAPESVARSWLIRSVAILALAVTAVYLFWRITSTLDLEVWWLSVALVALEVHAAFGLALFTFSLWDVDRRPAGGTVARTDLRVAVLVPTFNEGPEILTPTIAAAVALHLAHETWVLDDGNRPEVAELAEELGARYLARPTHEHAKAGNLNYALRIVDADVVAVFDADHVADADFLVHTLGYFDDPRVAIVQTPQDFYNANSFEHEVAVGSRERFHEQALFYRVLQAGKNRWGAAFWCGTGSVVRLTALRDVGGVATETITEDIHTTVRLHRRGWRTVYHNEVLARGLAAGDADTYQLQRHRWGTGAMQVLRIDNPLVVPGLSLGQRLCYAATLLGWFDAWRSLGYLALPMAVVVTGAVPIRADPAVFLPAFGATLFLQQLAMRVLSRGCHRSILSIVFELVRMTPNLLATITLVTHRRAVFRVSPKGRMAGARRQIAEPWLLRAVAFASVGSIAWFTLTLLGATPTHYEIPWAAYGAFAWLIVNVVLVVAAIRRIRSSRFAAERRAGYRFETAFNGRLDGAPARLLDVSLSGARIAIDTVSNADSHVLVIEAAGVETVLEAVLRSARPARGGGVECGLEFLPGQNRARAELALSLFGIRVLPSVADAAGQVAAMPTTMPEPRPLRAATPTPLASSELRRRRDRQASRRVAGRENRESA